MPRKLSSFSRNVIKPWPNGDASIRKLSTCVYLRLRFARTCARTCVHFDRDKIKFARNLTQVFSTFGHRTQVNTSCLFTSSTELQRAQGAFASKLGHPTQVCTQVHILKLASSCVSEFRKSFLSVQSSHWIRYAKIGTGYIRRKVNHRSAGRKITLGEEGRQSENMRQENNQVWHSYPGLTAER